MPNATGIRPRQPSTPHHVRGDSDPHADELLHRVRHPRGNWEICPECSGNLTPGGRNEVTACNQDRRPARRGT